MGGGYAGCGTHNLTDAEAKVARILYSRPRGNVDPDRDPEGSFNYARTGVAAPIVLDCERLLRP